jgi:hypothetical protein
VAALHRTRPKPCPAAALRPRPLPSRRVTYHPMPNPRPQRRLWRGHRMPGRATSCIFCGPGPGVRGRCERPLARRRLRPLRRVVDAWICMSAAAPSGAGGSAARRFRC